MPTVTSRSSRASSGCQVRSACSSISWGSRRQTARIMSITYSAIGPAEDATRVRDHQAPRAAGRGQDAFDPCGRGMDPAQRRRAVQEPVEGAAGEATAEHHLDVVERAVRRGRRIRSSRCGRPARRPGSHRGRGSGSGPRGSAEGDRHGSPARSPTGPRSHRGCRRSRRASFGPSEAPSARDPRVRRVDLRRASAASPARPTAGAAPRRPPALSIAATNASPLRYCSILRSMPVIRSIARSNGVRCSRRPWKRAEICSTPGTRSFPTASITWSPNPSSRLITACVSRNSARCSSVISRSSQCASSRRPSPRRAAPSARGPRPVPAPTRHPRTATAVAPAATRGTAAARDAPRTRRRASSRGARSRSGTARAARRSPAPSGGCSPRRTAGGPGVASALKEGQVVLAEDALAHEPQDQPDLARGDPAVRERHRRLAEAAARREDLVEEVPLDASDERPRRPRCWRGPSRRGRRRATRSTTPGSSAPRCAARGGDDPCHRRGIVPSVARSSDSPRVPGARRSRATAMSSTRRQSTSPARGRNARARRPATVTAAPSDGAHDEADLPEALLGIRRPPPGRRVRRRGRGRAGGPRARLPASAVLPQRHRLARRGRTRRTSGTRSTGSARRRRSLAGRVLRARRGPRPGVSGPPCPGRRRCPGSCRAPPAR